MKRVPAFLFMVKKSLLIAEQLQLFVQQRYRQTDNIVIVALDLLDQQRAFSLNAVRAGLVVRLAGGDIGVDLLVGQGIELNLCHLREHDLLIALKNGAAGDNLVGFARKQLKHFQRGLVGAGLAEHHIVDENSGVTADDNIIGMLLSLSFVEY